MYRRIATREKFQSEFTRYLGDFRRLLNEDYWDREFSDAGTYDMAISNSRKALAAPPERGINQNADMRNRYPNRYGRATRTQGVKQMTQDED